jgi:uncharacterized lipoprotein YddW (UPF0748 family)
MTRRRVFLLVLLTLLAGRPASFCQGSGPFLEGRALWANPPGLTYDDSSTQAFVEHCKQANINLIVLLVEYTDKEVYYHSKKFPDSIVPRFKDFDPLAAVIREAHKRGIRVHAWLCDFTQSTDGPIMQKHPEWAVRNPEGKVPAQAEMLGGGARYEDNWMCPARRPGYTDQWLIPMIEEIVSNYDVDGIHHDYVRYCGDVAPDSYCFCDYCLEEMLKYAHFYYEAFPDSIYTPVPVLPNPIANWSTDITVRPKEWAQWDRKKKAEFFLKGSFMPGGPADLDYFFYTYRQDQIKRFAREVWEHASAIKPNIEISAAVFKNPIMSGRFIGQRWTELAPWIDLMMPMVYRSHFPRVNYDTFITMLEEYTRYEYRWAKDIAHLSVGLDVTYMFNEERFFVADALQAADSLRILTGPRRAQFVGRVQGRYALVRDHLRQVAPEMEQKLSPAVDRLAELDEQQRAGFHAIIASINADPPEDFYPKEKLRRAIQAVRKGGGNGFVIYDGNSLTAKKLWSVLEEEFKKPSVEPYTLSSVSDVSIAGVKMLRTDLESVQRRSWYYLVAGLVLLFGAALVIMVRRRKPVPEQIHR